MFPNRAMLTNMIRVMNGNSLLAFMTMNALSVISCDSNEGNSTDNSSTLPPAIANFGNPREVTILGYSGNAMEPFISRDGNVLFFNNLNSASLPDGRRNDTNIHYAIRNDDITFQYMGEVIGANTDDISESNELEGVASIDKNNNFYFLRTIDYLDATSTEYLLSLFHADYANGTLVNMQGLPNLKSDRPSSQEPVLGELNFDAEIHHDGDVLYFAEGLFSGNPFPDEADIGVATNTAGVFTVNADSTDEMSMVNTEALEYAPSISSDRLTLYFTRATGSVDTGFDFGVYVATRSSVSDAWNSVRRIDAISGDITEGPSISFDGKRLYYHQKKSDVFRIYVVERE